MISLGEHFKEEFSNIIQERGKIYLKEKKIKIIARDNNSIVFDVHGTQENYTCYIDWKKNEKEQVLSVSCPCPHYKQGYNCKHLWASILYGDEKRVWNNNITGSRPIYLLRDNESYKLKNESIQSEPSNYKTKLSHEGHEDYKGQELQYLPIAKVHQISEQEPKPWKQWAQSLSQSSLSLNKQRSKSFQAYYIIDSSSSSDSSQNTYEYKVPIKLYFQEVGKDMESAPIKLGISEQEVPLFKDFQDREILKVLFSLLKENPSDYGDIPPISMVFIPQNFQNLLLSKMVSTGRLFLGSLHTEQGSFSTPLKHQESVGSLSVEVIEVPSGYQVTGKLNHPIEEKEWDVTEVPLITKEGIYATNTHIGHLDAKYYDWLQFLRSLKGETITKDEGGFLVMTLSAIAETPPIQWPESLKWRKISIRPQPKVIIDYPSHGFYTGLCAQVRYMYEDKDIGLRIKNKYVTNEEKRILYLRDTSSENEYLQQLIECGFSDTPPYLSDYDFCLSQSQFLPAIEELIAKGWEVEAYGRKVKTAQKFNLSVSSGINWFDLDAEIDFNSSDSNTLSVTLPSILASLKAGHKLIPLGSQEFGMIPEEWLEKYVKLANMGERHKDKDKNKNTIRFTKAQGFFLDEYLSEEEDVKFDLDFKKFQKNIKKFKMQKESEPSKFFNGTLRNYQKQGLSWMEYLKHFEIGGILADDMGLGKTIQVLSFLQKEVRKIRRNKCHKPSLIIVPKSLVFNWKNEANTFTPKMKVATYVGLNRLEMLSEMIENDIVITTYHTLRRDFHCFSKQSFHYVIIDEAQAIKNDTSQISQACKKIPGRNKLALTGTPVENSITDLFSIMDFTNPGLISAPLKRQFNKKATLVSSSNHKELASLNKALSPLILRRTKEQVLKDLPSKSISTLKCELSFREKKIYNDLKSYYQVNLSKKFAKKGFKRSKIDVLEALLRLRQAACHPRLLNKGHRNCRSAKMDTLLERLQEISSSGHKCLVFSQFTSFLKIVQNQLDRGKIKYCYLDGQTSKRQELVDTFQTDPRFKVFLISLKAGGVGLNLTAADYVFILDPWWNPAAEFQAIDRTHRIGQKNKVMAYKLISKGTVEEKILQLQETKKELSNAILSSDTGMLKKLSMEDLNFLLT